MFLSVYDMLQYPLSIVYFRLPLKVSYAYSYWSCRIIIQLCSLSRRGRVDWHRSPWFSAQLDTGFRHSSKLREAGDLSVSYCCRCCFKGCWRKPGFRTACLQQPSLCHKSVFHWKDHASRRRVINLLVFFLVDFGWNCFRTIASADPVGFESVWTNCISVRDSDQNVGYSNVRYSNQKLPHQGKKMKLKTPNSSLVVPSRCAEANAPSIEYNRMVYSCCFHLEQHTRSVEKEIATMWEKPCKPGPYWTVSKQIPEINQQKWNYVKLHRTSSNNWNPHWA